MTDEPAIDVLSELRAIAREVGENHEWLDADELEDDEMFARLVELLRDTERVSGDDFATAARDGSKYLRAGTLGGDRGRPAGAVGLDRAREEALPAGRLGRAAAAPPRTRPRRTEQVIAAVLAAADEDWSGSPLAEAVSEFLDARVARDERVTAADFGTLDARGCSRL